MRRLPPPVSVNRLSRATPIQTPAPLKSKNFGSTLVSTLKRSIEPSPSPSFDVEEWLDTSGLSALSSQVAVGELEEASTQPQDGLIDSTIGLDCRESTALSQLDEQCQTNAQN
jgi:hypothetical protein